MPLMTESHWTFFVLLPGERDALKNAEGLSKKQFYLRTRQLLKVGLVKRKKGRFSVTTLGAMLYHAEFIIENGIKNYWKLKAIDSIQSSGKIREHERISPIKTIFSDPLIEDILVRNS